MSRLLWKVSWSFSDLLVSLHDELCAFVNSVLKQTVPESMEALPQMGVQSRLFPLRNERAVADLDTTHTQKPLVYGQGANCVGGLRACRVSARGGGIFASFGGTNCGSPVVKPVSAFSEPVRFWPWLRKPVPKWNPGQWKHGPKPA